MTPTPRSCSCPRDNYRRSLDPVTIRPAAYGLRLHSIRVHSRHRTTSHSAVVYSSLRVILAQLSSSWGLLYLVHPPNTPNWSTPSSTLATLRWRCSAPEALLCVKVAGGDPRVGTTYHTGLGPSIIRVGGKPIEGGYHVVTTTHEHASESPRYTTLRELPHP